MQQFKLPPQTSIVAPFRATKKVHNFRPNGLTRETNFSLSSSKASETRKQNPYPTPQAKSPFHLLTPQNTKH